MPLITNRPYLITVPSWEVSGLSYDGISFDLSSEFTGSLFPSATKFKPDGTKMYVYDRGASALIFQYDLSSAWDLSTASVGSPTVVFDPSVSVPTNMYGMTFSPAGTKMVMTGAGGRVSPFTLSIAWDISSATYDGSFLDVNSQSASAESMAFKSDGTKMFLLGLTPGSVYQYTLSTAFDVLSGSYDSVSYATAGSTGREIIFKSDGGKFFIVDTGPDEVQQYTLSTAWDFTTASYDNITGDVSSQSTNPYGMEFKTDGTKVYVTDLVNKSVYQYSV
jgi:hypothetical protein